MQKWEYMTVTVLGMLKDPYWHDSTGKTGKMPELSRLNKLGADGWEVFGIAGSSSEAEYRLFLKRPKPASEQSEQSGSGGAEKFKYTSVPTLPFLSRHELELVLNDMGNRGWELAGILVEGDTSTGKIESTAVFKRPRL